MHRRSDVLCRYTGSHGSSRGCASGKVVFLEAAAGVQRGSAGGVIWGSMPGNGGVAASRGLKGIRR